MGLLFATMDHPIPPPTTNPAPAILKKILTDVREFTRAEPVATVATVCAVGLLVKLVPRSWIVGTVGVVGTALLKPALLSLGMAKAMEIYLQRPHTKWGTATNDA